MNTKEIILNQLIHTHVNQIKAVCLTNKLAYEVCSDPHFWIHKFEHDHIPLTLVGYPTTVQGWINEYKNMLTIDKVLAYVDWLSSIDYVEIKINNDDIMMMTQLLYDNDIMDDEEYKEMTTLYHQNENDRVHFVPSFKLFSSYQVNVILIYDDYQNEYDEVSLFQNTTKEKVHGFLLDVVHTINDFDFLYVSHTRPFQ